jgi:hypothetical protein
LSASFLLLLLVYSTNTNCNSFCFFLAFALPHLPCICSSAFRLKAQLLPQVILHYCSCYEFLLVVEFIFFASIPWFHTIHVHANPAAQPSFVTHTPPHQNRELLHIAAEAAALTTTAAAAGQQLQASSCSGSCRNGCLTQPLLCRTAWADLPMRFQSKAVHILKKKKKKFAATETSAARRMLAAMQAQQQLRKQLPSSCCVCIFSAQQMKWAGHGPAQQQPGWLLGLTQ